eukprot:scaffold2536_cov169-Amphora_coffeaeformis.AAC.16
MSEENFTFLGVSTVAALACADRGHSLAISWTELFQRTIAWDSKARGVFLTTEHLFRSQRRYGMVATLRCTTAISSSSPGKLRP